MHITRKFFFFFCFWSDLPFIYAKNTYKCMTNLLTPLCCTSVIFSADSKWDEMKIKNTNNVC